MQVEGCPSAASVVASSCRLGWCNQSCDVQNLRFMVAGTSKSARPSLPLQVSVVPRTVLTALTQVQGVTSCLSVALIRTAVAETLKEESATKADIDPSAQGDSIRRRFLNFYRDRGHKVLPSSSLVPEDPTVLLTIAGMLQFKPVFLGQVSKALYWVPDI